ncbi:MAG: NAD-binding protein [Candidatus Diapherotrites archaeon]|nr:NAD-binding protein [Candidatus Diapherotrites archaeon]
MYIIIVGAGRLGYHLAKTLLEEDHDVVIVDKNADVCADLSSELECVVVHGDGTKPQILEEAGIADADAVVALTGQDETNLIVCLMGKQMGAKTVAARLSQVHYDEQILQKLGLDLAIYPEAAAAGYIAELLTKPRVLDLAFIARGDAEIIEVEASPDSSITGKLVKDIKLPSGTAIIALYRGSNLIIPDERTEIGSGDKVLVLAKTEKVDELKKLLGL